MGSSPFDRMVDNLKPCSMLWPTAKVQYGRVPGQWEPARRSNPGVSRAEPAPACVVRVSNLFYQNTYYLFHVKQIHFDV